MGKHDRFNWENTSEGYFKKRTESLTAQLESAHKEIERHKRYEDKLEKALAESAERCAMLEKAFIEDKLGAIKARMKNVEM